MTEAGVEVTVRPEAPDDRDRILAIAQEAFSGPLEAAIVDGIRGTDRWIAGGSMVAVAMDGTLVGHLLASEGDLLGHGGQLVRRIWMVGPVAVLPEWQGRGVGTALMRAAIALATARGEPVLCLLGHAGYYPRFGFGSARALGIEPPRPWRDANWMALPLPAWDPSLRGVAQFPPAFPDASGPVSS